MITDFSNCEKDEIEVFYKKISYNVRSIRKKRKTTQLDLALEIGIRSVAFYSNCENNKYGKHFNLEHIYKIAKFFSIAPSELLK